MFLSAQTTCALLLGAGLLLRAQAHLRAQDENQGSVTSRTRPAQIFDTRTVSRATQAGQAPRAVRAPGSRDGATTRSGKTRTHARKPMAHRARNSRANRCGALFAQSNTGYRCG